MTDKELKNKLRALSALKAVGEPNALWITEMRAMLVEKISAEAPESASVQETIRLPRVGFWPKFMFAMRPVMAVVMLFGFGVFGYFSGMGAVASSLPGDALYGIKTATERAQLSFATGNDSRALLHAEFAARRASEVAALAELDDETTDLKVALTVNSLTDEMKNAGAALPAINTDNDTNAVAVAKLVDRKAAEVRAILGKTKSMLKPDSQKQIKAAENLADGLSLQAVAVLAASSGAKTDDVRSRVQENIDVAERRIEIASPEGGEQADAAKAALEQAQKAADADNYVEAVAKVQEATDLTAEQAVAQTETETPNSGNANANVNANTNSDGKIRAIEF